MPRFTQLPDPTWTQSDNDLLPKWLRFVKRHEAQYGEQSIDHLKRKVRDVTYWVQRYTEETQRISCQVKELEAELAEVRTQEELTDEYLMTQYEELIASPYVTGARTDKFGDLVVQFQPFDDSHTAGTLGTYELSYRGLQEASNPCFRFIGGPHAVWRALRWSWSTHDTEFSNDERRLTALIRYESYDQPSKEEREAVKTANLLPMLKFLAGRVATLMDRKADWDDTDPDHPVGWSGIHVSDPASALRVTLELSGVESIASQVAKLEENIKASKERKKDYLDAVRAKRKEIRDIEAEIRKLEAAAQDTAVEEEEARKTLAFITTIPGVVGFRFRDGIPVLHVRTSFVHEGRRYDLGDFEVHFTPHGDGVKVNRTRPPAGRDYTSGWHGGDWFCFGSRSNEIRTHFLAGNFAQFVNITIGTLNTISDGHEYLIREGHFVEIPMGAVPQRTLPRRPRRRGMRRPKAAA